MHRTEAKKSLGRILRNLYPILVYRTKALQLLLSFSNLEGKVSTEDGPRKSSTEGIGVVAVLWNTLWRWTRRRAEVNRLSMGISERWTSVGLGTRGVSLGTDASPRTTRADARVAVASAAVAVSSSFIFFFSPPLCSSRVLSSRFLCPISIYPFPRVSTYRGSETRRFAPSSSRREIVTLLLFLLFLCITSSR